MTTLSDWSDFKNYKLYIDDTGSRKPSSQNNDGSNPVFALGGYIVPEESEQDLRQSLYALINDFQIRSPLRSYNIRSKKQGFEWLKYDHSRAQDFYIALSSLISNANVICNVCAIHRVNYLNRYSSYGSESWWLCKSAYSILVERSAKFVLRNGGSRLKTIVEQSGKNEDNRIKQYQRELYSQGMPFNAESSSNYSPIEGEQLNRVLFKNPEFKTKKDVLIQLADLLLFPIANGYLRPDHQNLIELMETEKVIDNHVEDRSVEGVKYYCFDYST